MGSLTGACPCGREGLATALMVMADMLHNQEQLFLSDTLLDNYIMHI